MRVMRGVDRCGMRVMRGVDRCGMSRYNNMYKYSVCQQ